MKIQRCKGMRDLSPPEMAMFHLIEEMCRDCFLKWGYREVRTPAIEYLHLFTSAGTLTPNMLGKVYSFLDWDGWSGERVVLRPDGTIPVARMYTETMQGEGPARFFYTANMFRFEETGEQARERWQCGAELIGAGSAAADAELITLSTEILKKLGLKNIELRLSHAGVLQALLPRLGLNADEQHKLFDRILDGDDTALEAIGRKSPELSGVLLPLLSHKGQTAEFLRTQKTALSRSLPEIRQPLEDFLKVVNILDGLGIKYRIHIASGAEFEYYTGMVFQYFDGKEKIGGGGRYDALIASMGGKDVPASGFALYMNNLMATVKPDALESPAPRRILVKAATGDALQDAFSVATKLRQAGCIAEMELDRQQADWTLEVKSAAVFTLAGKSGKFTVSSVAEVLKALEGQGGG